MRVTIYQPQYFPRLHYFNRLLDSDTYVVLESAQYTKVLNHFVGGKKEKHKSYQSHSPIKLAGGEYFLSVPTKGESFLPINKTQADYSQKWVENHLKTIKSAYSRAPYFSEVFAELENILSVKYSNLAELNLKTILWGISKILDLNLSISSITLEEINTYLAKNNRVRLKKILLDWQTTDVSEANEKGDDWIIEICKSLGATEHVHGETSKVGYMNMDRYKEIGINPITQDWLGKEYLQEFSKLGFKPNLSIIDLLFNTDSQEAFKNLIPETVETEK